METITNKTLQNLGEILRINPYEPPRAIDVSTPPSHTETRFLVGPQFCLLSCAALVVSFASAVAIYLYYHHYKIAGIGDPILAGLAAESVVWIPIYRLASPSLILVMPKDCRSTFGTFFLILGLACCANDYALIFADWSIVTEAIGLYPAFAACIAISFLVFAANLIETKKRFSLILRSFGWLTVIVLVHGLFYAVVLSHQF